jgi:hypothetical protein
MANSIALEQIILSNAEYQVKNALCDMLGVISVANDDGEEVRTGSTL